MRTSRHLSILGIIGVAGLIFVFEQSRGADLGPDFGAVPVFISDAWHDVLAGDLSGSVFRYFSRLATAIFLHADIGHILFNMVYLWTFGILVSRHLGQWAALAVFLVTGVCGNILQVCLNSESGAPIIGASGAICGFEGAYLGLALRWHLPDPDVWPLAHPIPPLQLAAFAVIGFIGDMYFLNDRSQHIAFGAHVGGFLSGLAIAAVVTTIYPTMSAYQRAWRVQ